MNKFLISSLFAFACASFASAASSYWAAIETAAFTGDKSGGTDTSSYAAYYCTVEAANTLFGGTSVDDIEAYIRNNYDTAKGLATTFDSVGYSDGEYHILDYVSAAFVSSEYVAFALYGGEGYRAYGEGSAVLTPEGQLAFNADYAAAGTSGSWQQVAVTPEPTSGFLLLLGLSGLALRRKSRRKPEAFG